MSMDCVTIKCKICGRLLGERTDAIAASPCPHCGCLERDITIEFTDEAPRPHDSLEGKMKPAGGGNPVYEFFEGDDLQKSTGKWMTKERIIDRQNDKYREKVTDQESGTVIHHCEEPLSQHRSHGSAKHKK